MIKNLVDSKKEGDYWDFKQVWHKDNEKLLHDILCFANTVHDKNCYIIIGVADTGEIVGVSEENRMKQADLLDLLANTIFAGDNTPEVGVDTISLEGIEIDVITVFNSIDTDNDRVARIEKHRLSTGLALNRLLQEFRSLMVYGDLFYGIKPNVIS